MLLASCGAEIKFHMWPAGDYQGFYQIPEAGFHIPSISWCTEGELLVTTVPSLGAPIVISVNDIAIQTHQVIDLSHVQAATFSRTIQNNLAFGTETGNVMLYDLNKKGVTEYLASLPSSVKYLQYGALDSSLVAGCRNGQIVLYNAKNNVCATFYVPNSNSLTAMACHPKVFHLLASASAEGMVVVWDSHHGETKLLNKSHSSHVTDIAFSHGDDMATVGLDQRFNGYDLRSNDIVYSCKTDEQLSAVQFMPAGDMMAIGTIDGKLFCYDRRRITDPIHTIIAHHPKAIGRIAFQNIGNVANEIDENHKPDGSKSPITTVVYNGCHQENYASLLESAEASSQNLSTINTIIPDSDSEWQAPLLDEYAAYIENLQCAEKMGIVNPGEAFLDINLELINQVEQKQARLLNYSYEHIACNNISNGVTSKRRLDNDHANNLEATKSDAINNWIKKIPVDSNQSRNILNVSMDHDDDIVKLRKELHDVTKESIEQLAELMNREFLKVRMAVSRGFVNMEYKMNARWRDFNTALIKMAGYELCSGDELNKGDVEREDDIAGRIQSRIPTKNRLPKN